MRLPFLPVDDLHPTVLHILHHHPTLRSLSPLQAYQRVPYKYDPHRVLQRPATLASCQVLRFTQRPTPLPLVLLARSALNEEDTFQSTLALNALLSHPKISTGTALAPHAQSLPPPIEHRMFLCIRDLINRSRVQHQTMVITQLQPL